MKRDPHFKIVNHQNTIDGHRYYIFRIVAGNGETLAHSERYTRKANAVKACRRINPALEIRFV